MTVDLTSRLLVVRTSTVVSMEKLPLFIHGKAITDQDGEHNVGNSGY
jgi:hypothetical protein